MRKAVATMVVGLAVLATACTGSSNQAVRTDPTAAPGTTSSPDNPTQTKKNKTPVPYHEAVDLAIADIQDYWEKTLPEVYDQDYERIPDDALYPVTSKQGGPACKPGGGDNTIEDVEGNAFYCLLDGGFVEWDDEGLMPDLYKTYGEYAVAMVFAHEWGHAIQDQVGIMQKYKSILIENQADCFAGAWTAHALQNKEKTGFRATAADLTSALAGMLEFRDEPGTDVMAESAHGSGFDRVNGFQVGFEQGAAKCATWPEDPPEFTEFAFTDDQEEQSGGNVDYPQAIDLATNDLNAYWKKITSAFDAVESITRFSDDTAMPTCGAKTYTEDEALGTAFFCVDDNYVAWDDKMLEGVSNEIGDFGVAVILAQQWTASYQNQNGQSEAQIYSKQGSLQRACFTGAWTRAVWEGDEHNGGNLKLSPGDLDEAVKAFLAASETPDEKGETAGGTAFEKVAAFRDGFLSTNGASRCDSYSEEDARSSSES